MWSYCFLSSVYIFEGKNMVGLLNSFFKIQFNNLNDVIGRTFNLIDFGWEYNKIPQFSN